MGLVSTILIATVFLPFLYIAYLGKVQHKKINQLFDQEIRKFGYHFDEFEKWGNTFLGLDQKNALLVYMRYHSNLLVKQEISVTKIKECCVLVNEQETRKDQKIHTQLVKVNLSLKLIGEEQNPIILNFFDSDLNYREDHEVKRAEKWKQLVLKNGTPFKPLKSAA